MINKVYTGADAMTLVVSCYVDGEMDVRCIVRDSKQPDTKLTDRVRTISGDGLFYIRMPLCREWVDVILTNNDTGDDAGITFNSAKKTPLERRFDIIDFNNSYKLNEFIRFVQRFCYNAGILRTNDPNNDKDFYVSENRNFYIKYLPVIRDYETGMELETPARVSNDSPVIEVSQKHFIGYTVPMRLCTLFHEYSHPWQNTNPDDESEADLNGLIIYLGLGYPRIEAGEAWCEIFMDSASDENIERIAIIKQFIDNFEKEGKVFYNQY